MLSSLAPKEMELYTKIYMEHKQYHTIATELQTTEKAIRLRAFRLRKRMKELSKIIFSSIGHFDQDFRETFFIYDHIYLIMKEPGDLYV